jgi:hypothetical protein
MSQQIAQIYLASCPFCEYRQLFSSQHAMRREYEAHLFAHERDDSKSERSAGDALWRHILRMVEHMQRIEAAPYN